MVMRMLFILLCLGILSTLNGCYVEPYPYGYYAPRPYAYVYPRPYTYPYRYYAPYYHYCRHGDNGWRGGQPGVSLLGRELSKAHHDVPFLWGHWLHRQAAATLNDQHLF